MEEKRKKPRFSEKEIEVLVQCVKEKSDILFGKFNDVISNSKKKEAWNYVEDGVNAVSFSKRTIEELKKKWDDMKRGTKKRASAVKEDGMKTGGGMNEVQPLTCIEEDVVAILGEERVFGLSCGIDTIDSKVTMLASEAARGNVEMFSRPKSENFLAEPKKPKKIIIQPEENESLTLQRELVQIERQRLTIETQRLQIERRRLQLEEQRSVNFKRHNHLLDAPPSWHQHDSFPSISETGQLFSTAFMQLD